MLEQKQQFVIKSLGIVRILRSWRFIRPHQSVKNRLYMQTTGLTRIKSITFGHNIILWGNWNGFNTNCKKNGKFKAIIGLFSKFGVMQSDGNVSP